MRGTGVDSSPKEHIKHDYSQEQMWVTLYEADMIEYFIICKKNAFKGS